ncbi:MAG: nucleotidyltransferase family protein [Clostridia bacterium]|nr:nucleotidyltransferase family protein [Clostridia bacterium]
MKQAAYDLRYLAACAVNGITPDPTRVEAMDPIKLRKISKAHSLAALAAMAYAAAGVATNAEWLTDKEMAVRRTILFDRERADILRFLEERGIWYLPLKGIILKDMYPRLGMREMADNDILFDATRSHEVVAFMKQRGYRAEGVGKNAHDCYYKEPIFNFELHTKLFAESMSGVFSAYYRNIREKLIPDGNSQYGYRMRDEDYYIYMTAHEYKHFSRGGTGLRSLLDRYVYLSAKQEQLDLAYIEKECRTLGIDTFEKDSRALCQKVFATPELPTLDEAEREMLEYYMFSTTYGTVSQAVVQRMTKLYGKTDRRARVRYLLRRLFPKIEFYKGYSPLAYRYKVLIPFAWLSRLIHAIFKRRKLIRSELRAVRDLDKK